MDICQNLYTKVEKEVFAYLCLFAGKKKTQREIALGIKKSPTIIAKAIVTLDKEGVIQKESTHLANYITLNRESKKAIQKKQLVNLEMLYNSGFVTALSENFAGATIILFGSFSKGEDVYDSDIDIAVIGRKKKKTEILLYELKFLRKININFYNTWDDIHMHLKNNILNGIVLHGSIQL